MGKKVKKYINETNPDLLLEWDYIKNTDLSPESLTYGSHKKVWWIHTEKHLCGGYSWEACVLDRARKINPRGCPACAGKVVTKTNNLKVKFPEIAEEWHPTKNGSLKPEDISYGNVKKVWWLCGECGHSWCASINNRTGKKKSRGCPVCGRKKQVKALIKNKIAKNGSLLSEFPEISKEWHPTKNKRLTPSKITCGSGKRVWWECKKCGHSWKACVCDRTKKEGPKGCPVCAKNSVSKISQKWLDLVEVLECAHIDREVSFLVEERMFRFDGYDPETNTVYEFLGDYWHGNPEKFNPDDINTRVKKTFGQLYQETMERIDFLKENGYNVVYIWEKDYREGNK